MAQKLIGGTKVTFCVISPPKMLYIYIGSYLLKVKEKSA
jgi:hypothetical protein